MVVRPEMELMYSKGSTVACVLGALLPNTMSEPEVLPRAIGPGRKVISAPQPHFRMVPGIATPGDFARVHGQ